MRSNTRAIRAASLLLASVLATAGIAQSPAPTAELMPLSASRALVLAFAETDSRAIAVGERGHVLVSESRTDWRQVANVPTRATLTAVAAVGERVWAVGHDGVILHSTDGGLSWVLQREDVWTPPAADDFDAMPDPRQGAPLLDVLFLDADNGFAVGAYAMMLRTRDGGASWESLVVTSADDEGDARADATEASDSWTFDADDLTLDAETDPHLNGIVRGPDGLLFVVAERGAVFRSRDDGDSWERQQLPYDGSMFGVLSLGEGHLLAYGLRGNMLESRDGGDSWQAIDTGTELSLMGGANLPGGGWVVVGANGVVLHRASAEAPVQRYTFENENSETPVLSDVLPLGTRSLLVGGERGIGRFTLNATEAAQ